MVLVRGFNVKIGIIGVGHMGKEMALNLTKQFELTAYDVDKKALENLKSGGVKVASSPKEVAEVSDVVVFSLPNDAIVEDVILGKNGALQGAKAGSVFIDTSTVSPRTTRKLAEIAEEKGVEYIDATCGGGPQQIREKKLVMWVGGKKDVVEGCRKVLEGIGCSSVVYMGESGSGNTIKLIINTVAGTLTAALAEIMVLAAKAGVDIPVFCNMLAPVWEWCWRRNTEHMTKRIFEPYQIRHFSTDLEYKDMELGIRMAKDLKVPLILASNAQQLYEMARAEGLGKKDYTSVVLPLEKLAGVKVGQKTEN